MSLKHPKRNSASTEPAFPPPTPQTSHLHLKSSNSIRLSDPTQKSQRHPQYLSPISIIKASLDSDDCDSYIFLKTIQFSTFLPSFPRLSHHHFPPGCLCQSSLDQVYGDILVNVNLAKSFPLLQSFQRLPMALRIKSKSFP